MLYFARMQMKLVNISLLVAGLATAYSTSVSAEPCYALISEMLAKSAAGHMTKLVVTSHQANGVSSFSGQDPTAYYPGVVLEGYNGRAMTSMNRGIGYMVFSDRSWYDSPYFQHYSTKYKDAASLVLSLSPERISMAYVPTDGAPGHWVGIPQPQCENGLIWGLGTPVGDDNGSNRALWVFSYSYE
jgi:hypothetical protein